jgi:putative transposase
MHGVTGYLEVEFSPQQPEEVLHEDVTLFRQPDHRHLVSSKQRAAARSPELCREHGISSATFYKWRSKFGGMDASLMARLKELEDENRRLKKMYAEERLKAEIVQEALQKKW